MAHIIYINSLGLSVCDRAEEGAGWAWARASMAQARHQHERARHGRAVYERHGYPLVLVYFTQFQNSIKTYSNQIQT